MLVALGLQEMLKDLGYHAVGPIATIGEAMHAAQTEQFDGAILDVNLRGEPVHPVAEALRDRAIPFVFSTGYNSGSGILDAFREVPVLEKPYNPETLERVVRATFGYE